MGLVVMRFLSNLGKAGIAVHSRANAVGKLQRGAIFVSSISCTPDTVDAVSPLESFQLAAPTRPMLVVRLYFLGLGVNAMQWPCGLIVRNAIAIPVNA